MYSSGPPKPGAVVGFVGTLTHRSVGGMRISLYNAIYTSIGPALTDFMRGFQRTHG